MSLGRFRGLVERKERGKKRRKKERGREEGGRRKEGKKGHLIKPGSCPAGGESSRASAEVVPKRKKAPHRTSSPHFPSS